ncbi:hypothetical protein GQ55_5G067000 [Panicum hallii var. hallii]|uniref:Secreted protein n=1 Tax=Panicum hallii var. hallii TaxID=1504633 RepID=A0A2T7DDG0_9POAL|nr:hypothetical protein GQ55_5G067000 [Panicum hallii var. hallii]
MSSPIRSINLWLISGALASDQCAATTGQSRTVTPSTKTGFDISCCAHLSVCFFFLFLMDLLHHTEFV